MLEGIALAHLVALAVALFVGATVHGVVGLGVGLLLAPMTGLVEPSLLPGVPLWMALVLPLLTLARDRGHTDWSGLAWALPSRIPGTALGVLVVALASDRVVGIAVGVMVLAAVVLTVRTVDVAIAPHTLVTAGVISGVTGTATSIGGPPLALLYQHRPHDQVRPTLGVYFVSGAAFSLIALALTGQMYLRDAVVAGVLLPVLVAGFATSNLVRRRVPIHRMRAAMLAVCAASAVVLVARSLLA
ncbi:MAG: TSUP family transporter [Nocardioidaceae bacterium]